MTQNKHILTPEQMALKPQIKKIFEHYGHQCSMFSVWGSRTVDGHLFSARNLGNKNVFVYI